MLFAFAAARFAAPRRRRDALIRFSFAAATARRYDFAAMLLLIFSPLYAMFALPTHFYGQTIRRSRSDIFSP
jgi:hypothetical protein